MAAVDFGPCHSATIVMPGLDPGIHDFSPAGAGQKH